MAGETALARQLKKLAAPQTTGLIQDKIRKSFLFDHRDAAGLDRDLIFAYGTNGIEELCNVNPLFSKFKSNLFSLSYKDFERSVQSSEVNKKLDEKILEFLRMLSPYFLLRASHEALEWLIYRYHIHMYNVDDLIASVIPYFSTSVFVRVVQLLDLDERSRWFWLKPVQKSGVRLDYSAVLNRFISDGGFRRFICDLAPNVLMVFKNHQSVAAPIIGFSMLTAYNAISKCKVLDDKIITSLFPYILNGLTSKLSSYTESSYMVISQIVLKVKLSTELVEDILIRVFQNVKENLIKEAVEVLLLTFQNQPIKTLPKKVHSVILSDEAFLLAMCDLADSSEISTLLHALITKTIVHLFNASVCQNKKKRAKVLTFFKQLLKFVKWDEKCVMRCFSFTLKKYTKSSKNTLKYFTKIAESIIKSLERKYPDHFDKACRLFLAKKVNSNKKALCKLINKSVCKIKYKVLPSMKTSLVLGLNHANSDIRQISTTHLLDSLEHFVLENETSERSFIEDALYDRLQDSNPFVVQTVLSKPEIIVKILGKAKVLIAFENIFSRSINLHNSWYVVHMNCLHIIMKYFKTDGNLFDVFQIALHFLFPVNEHTVEGFRHLLSSNINNPFLQNLKPLKQKLKKSEDISKDNFFEVNCMVIAHLKDFISKMDDELKNTFSSFLMSKISNFRYNSSLVFYIYSMQYLILESSAYTSNTVKYIHNLFKVFRYYFMQSNLKHETFKNMSVEDCIKNSLDFLNKDRFPVLLVYYAFSKIVTEVKLSFEWKSWPNINKEFFNYYSILTNILDLCIFLLNSDKEMHRDYSKFVLSLVFTFQLKNIQAIFMFLSTKWINYMNDTSFTEQLSSINIATALSTEQSDMNWLFENDMIFFCLIKAISDDNSQISHLALNLLSSALSYTGNSVSPFKLLGEEISMKSEEIKSDYTQCFECIGNWLKPGIENMDAKMSANIRSELQNKISVFKEILNLLTKEEVPHSMKHFLLLCLQNTDSTTVLSAYIPVLYNYLNLLSEASNHEKYLLIIDLLLKKFTPKTAVCVTETSDETKALIHCLNYAKNDSDAERSVLALALNILSKEFFSSIKSITIQQEIFEILLTLYMTSPTNINTKVEKVLRKLCTYAYLFLKHFQDKELSVSKSTTLREAKKLRLKENIEDNVVTFEDGAWKKITVFLELIQNKSKLHNKEVLVPELFNLLNKSLDFDSQASVEYLRQLILSAIYSCCQQLGPTGVDERQFQVELIVQCIRTSTNAKTHHQSLLLLNLAATMFPDYVLSNVMSIFTFMGSSLIRQDDSYSFQVISQTIETIVPSLLEASNQQTETEGIQVVASVIRVFVDSLSDIPGHRQLPLFTKLITTLGPSHYLWIPLGQICDQYATMFHDITTVNENWKISPTLEFAVNLQKQFPPNTQIDSCIKLMNFIAMLPNSKEQLESCPAAYNKIKEPFNPLNHSYKQLQIYKLNVLSYMKIWLSSQAFLSQVSELNTKEQYNLEEQYEELLESVLSFLQNQLSIKRVDKDDGNITNEIQLLHDLVYTINSLLPCKLFIRVIRKLLNNNEEEIQIKAIDLLNINLEQQQEFLNVENHKSLLKLLKPLVNLSNKYLNEEQGYEKHVNAQQNTLYTLHLLTKLIGPVYPKKFYKVLNLSVTILSKYTQPELIVNALLCLAQLCSCLNVSILPHLNSFMPIIISVLQDKRIFNMSECLILGIIAALLSIIENLGMFLSSYMESILTGICIFSVKYSELGKKAISEKFINLQSKLADEIPLRVLLTAVENSYQTLSSENAESVVPLMRILTEKLNCSTYEDIMSYSNQLQKFYVNLLDFRNCNIELSSETNAAVESSIVSSLQTFIMKLSVTRFRTFFQKIYQWCTTTVDDQEQKYRVFTFYKLTSELSKSLKSLFSHMSTYFFRHVASLLDLSNLSKSKTSYFNSDETLGHELLINILDTLNYCFMYSKEQLLDKEHFDLLMQPLIDQIENISDEIKYQEIVENHLNKCIAHLMTAVSDSTLWKTLNYQLLLKTRHDSPKVRFGSLQVLREVVNKMGDNYLVLLPESIPFLAEMMEDESSEVEQECQAVIIEMEKILGEPIRKYF